MAVVQDSLIAGLEVPDPGFRQVVGGRFGPGDLGLDAFLSLALRAGGRYTPDHSGGIR
jgi:hypothetical protein